MKKTVTGALAVLLLMMMVFTLVSCGGGSSKSPYIGTWNATEVELNGQTITMEDAGMTFSVEFKEDGTVTATTNGEADGAGTWEETDNGVKITSGDQEITASLDGDTLILDLSGIQFKLTKE